MVRNRFPLTLAAVIGSIALSGCMTTGPIPYAGLSSSEKMKPDGEGRTTKIPYEYTSEVAWSTYDKLILDPVVVYDGGDNQFGALKASEKSELAGYMRETFSQALGKRFDVIKTPAQGRLRITLTITGAEETTPVLSLFEHVDIGGILYNGIQAMRGGQAAFGGSVSYAVEIYDSESGKLLKAYVSKQYPSAMNIRASIGRLAAAKAGLDIGATDLVAQLR
ncbi:conserved hypothetical protein [Paraburkholderia tropica]|uniref:DUF3313 domain-containing protein n=1 Tax=Paraburkholderia tropica TaxID=92647 RepID=UPI001CAD7BE2|nr:DUF3313 domain-containing protein [Paraburkholderia tropica]CAG9228505.1 conserved hypothetical protein [Paraburkholderia tropica]